MLFITVILALTVYYLWELLKPKAPARVSAAPESKPMFQFSNAINWEKMQTDAATARSEYRKSLELAGDAKGLAQMDAEDEHDAAIKAHHIPPDVVVYSESITSKDCVALRKELGERAWEAYERKHAAAKIGAHIWLHTENPYGDEQIRVNYAIIRVDTPARWERQTYYFNNENIVSSYKRHSESYAVHDAAPPCRTRKCFESSTITEKDKLVLYRTKTVDEWRDFMRLHEDATVGSLIYFFEGTLKNEQGVRVIHAIHRVDTPERWEEHTYMFRANERASCA